MNIEAEKGMACGTGCSGQVAKEFQHLRSEWWWLLLYGILLAVCGTAAVIFPAMTVLTTFVAVVVLGVTLVVAGVATVIAAFWAGKWGGLMLQLLVGVLYVAVGLMIMDSPLQSSEALTLFVAAFFIVAGGFRVVASLVVRFPFWGWSLLNGIVTFLLGVIIYRLYHHFPASAIWILGLLVGIEMLFHGWNWIMLSLAVRNIREENA